MKHFDTMSPGRLEELVARFSEARIAVLGDFFLDKYLDVDPTLAEASIETGKTAHQVTAVRHGPGAAGTVVCNLAALGAGELHAIGFIGDDGEGHSLCTDLADLACTTKELHRVPNRMTPTYLKPRNVHDQSLSGEHERYDTKNRSRTSPTVVATILASLDRLLPRLDALIVMDQVEEEDCGVVTAEVREALAQRAEQHEEVIFWADSRRRIRQFRHVMIKPNQFEAVDQEHPAPDDVVELSQLTASIGQLRDLIAAPIFVTRGPMGMIVSDPEPTLVPGVQFDGPTDPTGAGDSATAGAVLGLAAGATFPEAALLGNLVASITVQQLATTGTATPDQLPERLAMWQGQRDG